VGGSNFWLSHKKEKSPLTQGLNYRSACDFSSQFLKSGNILKTSRSQFPITTLTPVTVSIILNGSQLDAGSLIQAERNEKAFKRIQTNNAHEEAIKLITI